MTPTPRVRPNDPILKETPQIDYWLYANLDGDELQRIDLTPEEFTELKRHLREFRRPKTHAPASEPPTSAELKARLEEVQNAVYPHEDDIAKTPDEHLSGEYEYLLNMYQTNSIGAADNNGRMIMDGPRQSNEMTRDEYVDLKTLLIARRSLEGLGTFEMITWKVLVSNLVKVTAANSQPSEKKPIGESNLSPMAPLPENPVYTPCKEELLAKMEEITAKARQEEARIADMMAKSRPEEKDITKTPEEHPKGEYDYDLHMYQTNIIDEKDNAGQLVWDGARQSFGLTRREYIALKQNLAGLRGIGTRTTADAAEDDNETLVSQTPDDVPGAGAYYFVAMNADRWPLMGHQQNISISRDEFIKVKALLAALRGVGPKGFAHWRVTLPDARRMIVECNDTEAQVLGGVLEARETFSKHGSFAPLEEFLYEHARMYACNKLTVEMVREAADGLERSINSIQNLRSFFDERYSGSLTQ